MDNAAALLIDAPVEEGAGDRIALVTPEGSMTYRDLQELTDRAAWGLRALGVEPEQRVALLLPDGVAFAATFFAALKIGAVAVPLNTRLSPADQARLLSDCRATVLVADPEREAALSRVAPEATGPRAVRFEALGGGGDAPFVPEPVGTDAPAFWLYTSGTTGLPKAVMHGHRTLVAGRRYGEEVLEVGPGDRIYASSKLFFAYALGNALLIPLLARASAYLAPEWPDPAGVQAVMAAYRPTVFFSVPTFYARLLRSDLPRETFSSVRQCVSAGERLPAEIFHAWTDRFGVEILDGMGATETVFMVLSNRPRHGRAGSVGTPVPGTEARLLNAEGQAVRGGEQGVLWVRTPSAAFGYWRRLDESRRAFVGDWFRTGDVCYRDADGLYVHCGRDDDRFKVAGLWVIPAEVEASALRHPGVLEAAVVGAEAVAGLVKPVLFVVPRDPSLEPGRLETDLRQRLTEELPAHQRPHAIVAVPELPRTATGKVQRFKLREQACRLR